MSAETWAASEVGVADLLAVARCRRDDVTRHELVCIHEHLAPESATVRNEAKVSNGLTNLLLAEIIDSIHELACGLNGNQLKESDRLAPLFSDAVSEEKAAKAVKKAAKKRIVVEGLKARGRQDM